MNQGGKVAGETIQNGLKCIADPAKKTKPLRGVKRPHFVGFILDVVEVEKDRKDSGVAVFDTHV